MDLDLAVSSRLIEGRIAAFSAMGTRVEVSVWANPVLSDHLVRIAPMRLEALEQSWSRFRPTSELNSINGLPVADSLPVSADMALLLTRMNDAKRITKNSFSPHVAEVMCKIGYDRTFSEVLLESAINFAPTHQVQPQSFVIDNQQLTFQSPLSLDAGGIGKGLAGDILTKEFMALGATGVLVNIGGDLVAAGSPGEDMWRFGITSDREQDKRIGVFETQLTQVAIATSSTFKRRFGAGRHHIIDPNTGDSAETDISQISIVANEGWHAEALGKAAMLKGFKNAGAYLTEFNLAYLIVSISGQISSHGVEIC